MIITSIKRLCRIRDYRGLLKWPETSTLSIYSVVAVISELAMIVLLIFTSVSCYQTMHDSLKFLKNAIGKYR